MTDAICEVKQVHIAVMDPPPYNIIKKTNMPYCVEQGKPRATEHPKKDRHI
jgi:hypothetical protein